MNKQGMSNQERRTRKELLLTAARLLKNGRKPSMDEVAKEALVSRATAYRYFPNIETLLVEAPLEGGMPAVDNLFDDDSSLDPAERIDKAEALLHEYVYNNEAQLRLMLSCSLSQAGGNKSGKKPVTRQNRRSDLIEAALNPARDQIDDTVYDNLCAALAVMFATESMIVFQDVLQLDRKTARKVKSWAVKALVRAALEESID